MGSFSCSCNTGLVGNGISICKVPPVCLAGLVMNEIWECGDIDECVTEVDNCHVRSQSHLFLTPLPEIAGPSCGRSCWSACFAVTWNLNPKSQTLRAKPMVDDGGAVSFRRMQTAPTPSAASNARAALR